MIHLVSAWETFLTSGESTDYGDGTGEREARIAHKTACCAPQVALEFSGHAAG